MNNDELSDLIDVFEGDWRELAEYMQLQRNLADNHADHLKQMLHAVLTSDHALSIIRFCAKYNITVHFDDDGGFLFEAEDVDAMALVQPELLEEFHGLLNGEASE